MPFFWLYGTVLKTNTGSLLKEKTVHCWSCMFWFQKLEEDHQFGLIFLSPPLKYTHKYNCCLVIKPLCSRLQGHHAAALHKPHARWGGCVFTVFLQSSGPRLRSLYSVVLLMPSLWPRGGRSRRRHPLRRALNPLVRADALVKLHWFVLFVSYGQLPGHWGNWWAIGKKTTQLGGLSGHREENK